MLTVEQFLNAVQQNAARVTTYHEGGDGTNGLCDCVGLIIGALRLCGIRYTGVHGSNWFARYETEGLRRFEVATVRPGDLAYKALEPGASGYDLPSRYARSADKRDYCHIGVVLQVYPLDIVHCSTDGIKHDSRVGKWRFAGRCVYVKEGEQVEYTATVAADSGSTVKMRSKPSQKDPVYWDVPIGATVTVVGTSGAYSRISYGGKSGFMLSRFLVSDESEADPGADPEGTVAIQLKKSVALDLLQALRDAGCE